MSNQRNKQLKITERALVQRLKRRFARDGQAFRVTRGRLTSDLGCWHAVEDNLVVWSCHSLEALVECARGMGAMQPYEELAASA